MVGAAEASARHYLAKVLSHAGCAIKNYDEAMEVVRLHARVVLHFHPDRVGKKRISVAEALLREGLYRNQFETGLSTGSLTAFPGGGRDSWENILFRGAYHTTGV